MLNLNERLADLKTRYGAISAKFDRGSLNQDLRKLEAESLKSDFWSDVIRAQEVMQKISDLRNELKELDSLSGQLETIRQLTTLPENETADLDLEKEVENLEKKISEKESRLFLSGSYDRGNCLLAVHAGQGGVEAMDWAAMLLRMYQRYAENKGWTIALIDETKGEEAGIKSATSEIHGSFAYGLLKKESGTHRLVRLSPFNANNLRQTSFALVEVLPIIETEKEARLKEAELEIDTFRSSGPGGQNVQKVATAVRVKHLPTGIVVTCQSERSQFQNKENAIKILKAKVFQREEAEKTEREKGLKSWDKTASWGTQIRSYVLHPYKLVKDLRTGFETSATESVLDGNLDKFIEAEIQL